MDPIRPLARVAGALAAAAVVLAGATDARAEDGFQSLFGSGWTVGGALVVSPKYEGSDSYEVTGAPFIFPGSPFGGSGIVTFSGIDSLQIRVIRQGVFEAGPLVGLRFGRDEDDGPLLRGLGDVDGGVVLGGYGAVRLGSFIFTTSYHHQVGGDDTGGLLRLRGAFEVQVTPATKLTFGVGTNYATDEYMDAFFSVTPAQAANSVAGLPIYDADAGFKDVFLSVTAAMQLDQRWGLFLSASYAQLVGDAGDSPVIETQDQFTGTLAVTYKLY
ncbi:MAG TPA: MipA/OmpV family protein [Sphingomicrobium sp.]|nr:MipA/OmpV family protein [Sphingomicrobium sp.]